jgi:signal transduction histidine kinase
MSRLLNALLDISKLESGAIKPELTDFRVVTLASEMRAEFAALAASKGLKLEVYVGDEVVHSDAVDNGATLNGRKRPRNLTGEPARGIVAPDFQGVPTT